MSDDAPVAPFGGDPTALDSLEDLHFAQITDVHLSTERRCLPADFRGDLARILERHDLDFIIASGDLTAGGKPEEFAAFRDIVDSLSVPVYPAAGNHDDDSSVDAGAYRQALGPLHYSTRVGPLHLVVYDGEAWQREGLSAGENGEAFPWIASTIDDWLDADLTALSPDQPILLVNHFPWGEQLYRRMRSHRIVGVLSGHWHRVVAAWTRVDWSTMPRPVSVSEASTSRHVATGPFVMQIESWNPAVTPFHLVPCGPVWVIARHPRSPQPYRNLISGSPGRSFREGLDGPGSPTKDRRHR